MVAPFPRTEIGENSQDLVPPLLRNMREILQTVEQEFVIGYGRGVNWTKSGVRFLIPLALRIDLCIIISLLRLPKRSAFSE